MKNPLRGLWILLFSSLLFFALLSYTGMPTIFGHELKDNDIYSHLTSKENLFTPTGVTDFAKPVRSEPVKVELDTASKSILFIGDSMLEGLSPRLAAYSKMNGHKLNTVIWYSSTSEYWGKCDTLKHYIKQFNPNYIFICLGANELFVKDIKKKRAKYVDHILSQIGEIPYLWIGPPNWKEDTGINDLLEMKLKQGSFFLSNGMKFDRTRDGAHPTRTSAALWMDSVGRWMKDKSNHPIKMAVPQEKKARANHTIVLQPLR